MEKSGENRENEEEEEEEKRGDWLSTQLLGLSLFPLSLSRFRSFPIWRPVSAYLSRTAAASQWRHTRRRSS